MVAVGPGLRRDDVGRVHNFYSGNGARSGYCCASSNQRSSAERVNSNLKDNCGGNHVRVRGAANVLCYLMFCSLMVTVEQLMRLVT